MTTIDFYLNDLWSRTMKNIVSTGQVPETILPYYDSKLVSISDEEAVVTVPSFINYSIMGQNVSLIENCFEEVLGKDSRSRSFSRKNIVLNLCLPKNSGVISFPGRSILTRHLPILSSDVRMHRPRLQP